MQIGKYNILRANREVEFGVYLYDPEDGIEVLLPGKYVPPRLNIGEEIEVFVYRDSQNRPVATTLRPKAVVGQFAFLEVKQLSQFGAFVDLGLEKDLMIPFKEQEKRMVENRSYVVYIYLDEKTDRIVGSSNVDRFLKNEKIELLPLQEVDCLVYKKTDLGLNVIVDNQYKGLVHSNEIFRDLKPGDRVRGFVKTVRPDHKIDISLEKQGKELIDDAAQKILDCLKENNGFIDLHDNSEPAQIQSELQMSKKAFKRALGTLYKAGKIRIERYGTYLAE